MPYSTIPEAKEAGFPVMIGGVELTLAQVNHLAEMYDAIKAKGDVETPMAVAIAQFKKAHEKEGGAWVKLDDMSWLEFKERAIATLTTSQAAMSYHNRLHAMYVDNRQTGKAFSKSWVIEKHRELVAHMKDMGWTHPKRGDALDKTLGTEYQDSVSFDESGLKEGKPVLVLRLGDEYDSITGKKRVAVTAEMARQMVENFNSGVRPGIEYGMPIDFDHALANVKPGKPVKKPTSADRVAGYVKKIFFQAGKGIMAVPKWTQETIDLIKQKGVMGISSFFGTKYHNKRTGKDAGATFFNFTLTPRPQQTDLAVTAQTLTEMGNDKDEIYITHINLQEEEEKEMQFNEEITKALGESPEEKITAWIALEEKHAELEKEHTALQERVKDLEKRPEASEYEALSERTKKLEEEARNKEMQDREKILLTDYMTPAQIKTKVGQDIKDPVVTSRSAFDEYIKNATKLDDKLKGYDPGGEQDVMLTEEEHAERKKLGMTEEQYQAYKDSGYSFSVIDDLDKTKKE